MSRATLLIALLLLAPLVTRASGLLGESPLRQVPAGMSYEEYRDANRRLLPTLALASVLPVPGIVHYQADETRTGLYLTGAALLGGAMLFTGASSSEQGDYPSSDYTTVDINGLRYERIPVELEQTGDAVTTRYRLRELQRKQQLSGAGAALVLSGAALLASSLIYDWWHGIDTIVDKRDRVRYKYGRQVQLGLEAMRDEASGATGLGLSLRF